MADDTTGFSTAHDEMVAFYRSTKRIHFFDINSVAYNYEEAMTIKRFIRGDIFRSGKRSLLFPEVQHRGLP